MKIRFPCDTLTPEKTAAEGRERKGHGMELRIESIPRGETLRYLGIRGHASAVDEAELTRLERVLRDTARPRGVWRLLEITADGTLAGTAFRPAGASVQALLTGCESAVLMAATLGAEVDALLRRTGRISMADAALLDALANAAIESVCDRLCAELAGELHPRVLTPRFSPGYGDFPLSQQPDFLAVLDMPRRMGVTLTPGGLMLPQKTVTALMGVSDHPLGIKGRGCEGCAMAERCLYRKEGITCGK